MPQLAADTSLRLDLSNGVYSNANQFNPDPSSTLISTGSDDGAGGGTSGGGNYMCYAWKAVAGVSAFGSYTGNGGAGAGTNTITYTGGNSFFARLIIIKNRDTGANWAILDTFRGGTGEITINFEANEPGAESNDASLGTTPTATGFTFDAGTTGGEINTSGSTYIYWAFA